MRVSVSVSVCLSVDFSKDPEHGLACRRSDGAGRSRKGRAACAPPSRMRPDTDRCPAARRRTHSCAALLLPEPLLLLLVLLPKEEIRGEEENEMK